jgi:hypothetical protein
MGGFGVLLSALLATAAPVSPDPERDAADQLGGVSPARLIPRLEVRQRFTQLPGDGGRHTTTLRMDIVLWKRALLRYEMPLVAQRAGPITSSGMGDIRLSAIGLVTSGPRHAAIVLAGLSLDSASRRPLGAGKEVAVLGGAAAFKVRPWLLAYGIVGEQFSFAGDESRPPVNVLRAELGAAVFGGHGDWYLVELEAPLDLEEGAARLLGAAEVGRLLIGRLGLFVRGGTQLAGQRQVEYFVDAGMRYLFRI